MLESRVNAGPNIPSLHHFHYSASRILLRVDPRVAFTYESDYNPTSISDVSVEVLIDRRSI